MYKIHQVLLLQYRRPRHPPRQLQWIFPFLSQSILVCLYAGRNQFDCKRWGRKESWGIIPGVNWYLSGHPTRERERGDRKKKVNVTVETHFLAYPPDHWRSPCHLESPIQRCCTESNSPSLPQYSSYLYYVHPKTARRRSAPRNGTFLTCLSL